MECVTCKNRELGHGFATIILERDEKTFVFKKVPARICENCVKSILMEKLSII